jgi:arylformamidase
VSRIYDISVPITDGGVTYPGNPPIRVSYQQAISKGAGANVSEISFGSHTATHIDAAKHFIDDGASVDAIPLELLIGPALVIAFPDDVMSIGRAQLMAHPIKGHERVLLRTRNSCFWGKPDFVRDYTYLAPDGADYLVELGVRLVGIDYLSIEQFQSGDHRTHLTLLGNGTVIIEGLNLLAPRAGIYELICLPLLMQGIDGAPARAVLRD